MIFNSYTFALFFIVVLVMHNLPISWKAKKINLLTASYLFYALWNPPFILLLWLSTVVDFYMAKLISATGDKVRRKLWLAVSLVLNLGMLSYFKYGGFLLESFVALMNGIGVAFQPAKPDIILPVGISFYTFVTLSYTIDVYRRKFAPEKSLLDFALFVTYFPHLVAGPIVRPEELIPQFKQPVRATSQQMLWGLFLLTLGLFLKVVIADGWLSETSDLIFGVPFPVNPLDAWSAVLAFSGQIFCDFSGYSTCAIGVSLCLGFRLPENFRYPYASIGFSDFWRRWHITLSSWLRDYLYIPLGGNRSGRFRTYANLMVTMLLGGLWHGASWNFVIWGGLHGLFLWIERLVKGRSKKSGKSIIPNELVLQASLIPVQGRHMKNFLAALLTFFLVNVTWVFFRAPDFTQAIKMLLCMFGVITQGPKLLSTPDMLKVAIVTVGLLICHWNLRNTTVSSLVNRLPWWIWGTAWTMMAVMIILTQKSSGSFIYFQF
nr:MBOAT family O-acyltransferase [uncultured Dyadobacter sp.]